MNRTEGPAEGPAADGRSRKSARAWAHYVLVAALAGLVLFWRLNAESLDDHEARAAVTGRTMADPNLWLLEADKSYDIPPNTALNHWMVPVENGRPRLVKTPMSYWLIALTARTGPGVTTWTARFPSAVAGVLCALVVLAIGRRMFSPRAALLGAVIFTAAYCFQRLGRNARPEMLLCLWMTAAMGSFYLALDGPTRRWRVAWMLAFWVSMGLGNLAKEFVPMLLAWPLAAYLLWRRAWDRATDRATTRWLGMFMVASAVGIGIYYAVLLLWPLQWWDWVGLGERNGVYGTLAVVLGLPMLWYFVRTRGWPLVAPPMSQAGPVSARCSPLCRRLLRAGLPVLLGAVLMLSLFMPWMLYMNHLFPGLASGTFSEQVTERAAGTGRWYIVSPYVYLQGVLTYALPWVALLPGAFVVPWMRRFAEYRRGLVYLTLWCLGLLLLLVAAAVKREHYLLPAMPPLCLLIGFVAEDVFFEHRWIRPGLARWVGGAYGIFAPVALVVLAALWVWQPAETMWRYTFWIAVVAATLMAAAGAMAFRRRFRPVVGLLVAAMVVMYVGNGCFCELWDEYQPGRQFYASAARIIPPGAPVYHWGEPQPQAPYYLGRYLPEVQWGLARLEGSLGKEEGLRRWNAWLSDPNNAPWVLGYYEDAAELAGYGYELVGPPVQGLGKRKRVYAMYRRGANPPASAPAGAR